MGLGGCPCLQGKKGPRGSGGERGVTEGKELGYLGKIGGSGKQGVCTQRQYENFKCSW